MRRTSEPSAFLYLGIFCGFDEHLQMLVVGVDGRSLMVVVQCTVRQPCLVIHEAQGLPGLQIVRHDSEDAAENRDCFIIAPHAGES